LYNQKKQALNIEKNAFISTLDFSENLCRFTPKSSQYQANIKPALALMGIATA
jgi:putative component of membrane protein insertase Oxa1/YidC/SpoIIIJ protein YidD